VPQRIAAAVCEVNGAQKARMVDKIEAMLEGGLGDKTIGVLGLSYKPNTDDVRDSPAIEIIRRMQDRGARVRCFDPQAMKSAARELKNVEFCKDPYDAAKDCDALVLATEWNEFRLLDLDKLRAQLRAPVLIDLRNVYDPRQMAAQGFRYSGVGRTAAAMQR